MKGIVLTIAMVAVLVGCRDERGDHSTVHPSDKEATTCPFPASSGDPSYPHVASLERKSQIRDGMARVQQGMTPAEVRTILGEPDNPGCLGGVSANEWWFFIRRKANTIALSTGDQLVRVTFDSKHNVADIHSWGTGFNRGSESN